ncbi:hypothetical protein A2697_00875 [Candidatus Curtissbacteria bacterium RIFCSPHIGHO2_01_FULL_41_44]|uniref:2-oxoacid ferredoxin oxidoreductase n=1 Tax=Candidatus Curtissbacteria bacterium RIFCSPLOWO2_01_FULL_42_50 TaxID=1797730 RepID=A0A1F5H890_9BACT|nr:MAG: hypothetical protein A3C33_04615 [Candidatus Curtissbacteria bacterium RIFCSPHIGHO2_02_FULL_42_58]OGD94719.1 MAG: hypothetical protein A2697_00875 [Candidatus Curtissbacteria bacterium RIFCSPHIGHO2_01_FULL_41_44]OGD96211.1 MAG: hypothetical protein A3E71_03990 [Candidatus Curtissbacteria bacterium RIFCSPHIGHO2_12_FULL_42_33]OGE00299.1 MAG: hypothetical protein A3B54_03520 [Candidatus Curtissbacteria bacterium RIFCSPLOWO2_01_FULL_42_50]OGE03095.1 MAG: hypothetical protein A3G16_04085 [Ca
MPDYPFAPTWCPGCGNFAIWAALKNGIATTGVPSEKFAIFYDVGCAGDMADFNTYYGFHTLHGRALPTAVGAKLANHDLKVIVVIGDGGCYGEGGTHFINLMRGNHDITVLVHNNHRYSLTTGQMSPTTEKGTKTKSTPEGSIEEAQNPIALAVSNHATFVAREFAPDIARLASRITQGIKHGGFALIDILQPCPIFNPVQSPNWYRERLVKLEDEGHSSENLEAAWKQSMRTDKLPIGLFFQESKPAYHEQVTELQDLPLVKHPIETVNLTNLLKEFK